MEDGTAKGGGGKGAISRFVLVGNGVRKGAKTNAVPCRFGREPVRQSGRFFRRTVFCDVLYGTEYDTG